MMLRWLGSRYDPWTSNLLVATFLSHDEAVWSEAWPGLQGGAAAAEKQGSQSNQGGGRFRAIIDTVIGNLQLSITNVHIRFEVYL